MQNGFKYQTIKDKSVRDAARDGARVIKSLLTSTGAAIVEIGRLLLTIRETLDPPAFQAWLQAEFDWGQPCAHNYMAAARRFGDVPCLDKMQPFALTQLARRNAPEAAAAEAVALASAGEFITGKRAKELITKHGGEPTRIDAGLNADRRRSGRTCRRPRWSPCERRSTVSPDTSPNSSCRARNGRNCPTGS